MHPGTRNTKCVAVFTLFAQPSRSVMYVCVHIVHCCRLVLVYMYVVSNNRGAPGFLHPELTVEMGTGRRKTDVWKLRQAFLP